MDRKSRLTFNGCYELPAVLSQASVALEWLGPGEEGRGVTWCFGNAGACIDPVGLHFKTR
jgi:hypothetical protein